tara:strand:- start:1269 stop:1535 length:267 start_codon:yes stop_codon:yes gene_type:complete
MYINRKIKFSSKDDSDKNKFFCKLCDFPLVSFDDLRLANDWPGCCHECFLSFVEARKKEWKDGWRPDKETLDEYIYKRHEILLLQEKK